MHWKEAKIILGNLTYKMILCWLVIHVCKTLFCSHTYLCILTFIYYYTKVQKPFNILMISFEHPGFICIEAIIKLSLSKSTSPMLINQSQYLTTGIVAIKSGAGSRSPKLCRRVSGTRARKSRFILRLYASCVRNLNSMSII